MSFVRIIKNLPITANLISLCSENALLKRSTNSSSDLIGTVTFTLTISTPIQVKYKSKLQIIVTISYAYNLAHAYTGADQRLGYNRDVLDSLDIPGLGCSLQRSPWP